MSSLLLPALHVAPSPAPPEDDVSSSEGSSIGSASSDAESESEIKDDVTSSLGSLEDSLPIKKGLSNHFVGKSRSFTNLSECENGNAVDLAKGENPFNKRRRIQISYQRRASCSSLVTVSLPSLLSPEHALQEAEEENDDDDDGDDSGSGRRTGNSLAPTPLGGNLFNGKIMIVNNGKVMIKSPRSFPLFDL